MLRRATQLLHCLWMPIIRKVIYDKKNSEYKSKTGISYGIVVGLANKQIGRSHKVDMGKQCCWERLKIDLISSKI